MAGAETGGTASDDVTRVSGAMGRDFGGSGFRRRIYEFKVRVMVDVNRWILIAALVTFVFAVSVLVGAFGPVSARRYLAEGTTVSDVYVEL